MTTVSREVAEQEFERFLEEMDLSFDGLDDEDASAFNANKNIVVGAIEKGRLVINEQGEPVYSPTDKSGNTEAITFHEPTGASLMAIDGKKDKSVKASYAVMSNVTGEASARFANMKNRDARVCRAILTLFLA